MAHLQTIVLVPPEELEMQLQSQLKCWIMQAPAPASQNTHNKPIV